MPDKIKVSIIFKATSFPDSPPAPLYLLRQPVDCQRGELQNWVLNLNHVRSTKHGTGIFKKPNGGDSFWLIEKSINRIRQ